MCDPAIYRDPLPDIAVKTLRDMHIHDAFVSRSHDGVLKLRVPDRREAFTAFAALRNVFPDSVEISLTEPPTGPTIILFTAA